MLVGVTVVTREPEYTDEDRARLIALRRLEQELGPHGYPMSEAMDPANQFAFEGYEKPRTDFVEKARKDAMDAYYKRYPDADRNGHIWGVKRRT